MKNEYKKLLKEYIIILHDDSEKGYDIPNELFLEDFLNTSSSNKKLFKKSGSVHKRKVEYLPNLNTGIAEITVAEKRKLLRTGRVINISRNKVEKGIVIDSLVDKDVHRYDDIESIPNNWGIQKMNIDRETSRGASVKIAIIDSGIDRWHPCFKNKIDFDNNVISYVPSDTSIEDKTGHGTHCAGIIGGDVDPNGVRFGIASEAELYIIKVIDQSGFSFKSWIIKGIEWAISKKCNIVNISITSKVGKRERPDKEYSEIIKQARAKGLIVVAAVGNDSYRNTSGRSRRRLKPIGKPANSSKCIAVTAVDDNMKIYVSANAGINTGQNVTYAAPGVNIYSSVPASLHTSKFCNLSGTSMAAPFITGSLALLMDKHRIYDPKATLQLLDSKLQLRSLSNADYGKGIPQF